MEIDITHLLRTALLSFVAILYVVIAVFRSASAELNAVTANRLLANRGLQPREGGAPNEIPSVMRMAADVFHHLVLIIAAVVSIRVFEGLSSPHPFLSGGFAVAVGAVLVQIGARLLALSSPELAFQATLPVVSLLYYSMRPFIALFVWALRKLRSLGRARRAAAGEEEATDEEIEAFIGAGEQEGMFEEDEGRLIRQVVEFHDSLVREVMTPRTELVAIPAGSSIAEARAVFARERHSRLPVFRDQLDNIEGMITLKDLVAEWDQLPPDAPVENLMKPAYFVPEKKKVSDLMKEFQARRMQLAIVVDEFGGTAGVVTIEDLLEELVGDIQEEHEEEEQPIVEIDDGTWLVSGSANLAEFEEALGVDIAGDGFETVSGLVYSVLGRIPAEGETLEVDGLRFEIVLADSRRIDRVRVKRLAEKPSP